MKTNLLRSLKHKHQIRVQTIDVIKCLYSVTPLHHMKYYNSSDPEDAIWCTRDFSEAKNKQRELILNSVRKYQVSVGRYYSMEKWKNITWFQYLTLKIFGYAVRKKSKFRRNS